jgi:aarF domain-containing kinase
MIFEKGFVHSDPHPGNMFVRRKKNGKSKNDIELVILDHGIYTALTEETRLSYTKLWRGILSQDEKMIRESSKELGADFYELFTAMIVNRTYADVMNTEKQV